MTRASMAFDVGTESARPMAAPVNDDLRPIFIMGPHRSGTTILYKVLGETGLFNIVTAFHVLNHDRLRAIHDAGGQTEARRQLVDLFDSKGLTDREFDAMPITPDLPEEYAWILDRQGRHPRLDAGNMPGFEAFCRAVSALQRPERPLLLKNPFDTDNFLFMHRALPQAKFVFIHRDPAAVVSSQIRAIRSVLEQPNEYVALVMARIRRLYRQPLKLAAARAIYGERSPFLIWQVGRHLARTNARLVRHAGWLRQHAIHVTYPELCARPAEAIGRVLAFLEIETGRPPDYASLIRPRNPALLPEVQARQTAIRRQHAAYCEMFGV